MHSSNWKKPFLLAYTHTHTPLWFHLGSHPEIKVGNALPTFVQPISNIFIQLMVSSFFSPKWKIPGKNFKGVLQRNPRGAEVRFRTYFWILMAQFIVL